MNFIKKVISFFKNIFSKQEEVKKLVEPKTDIKQDKKENFVQTLKITIKEKKAKKKVETLVCNGDGLGIQEKITY